MMTGALNLSESYKYSYLHGNALVLCALFGWVMVNILYRLRDYFESIYEALSLLMIATYCLMLSARELGYGPDPIPWMHGYDVFLFFILQAVFIGLHIFTLERARQTRHARQIYDFQLEQERTLNIRLREAEDSEKKRIARDIHDEIGSIFVSMNYILLTLRERFLEHPIREGLDRIRNLSDMGIRKQYAIIDELMLNPGEGKSLQALLKEKAGVISDSTSLNVDLQFEAQEEQISEFQKVQIHRILSELISNTIKHAEASEIHICLKTDDGIHIRYADNGLGFQQKASSKGMGLLNIQHRVDFMRGKIEMAAGAPGIVFNIYIPFGHDKTPA